jgi:sugar O-acyltransferase (sialic acid O-acetyltransferase NeuD family)
MERFGGKNVVIIGANGHGRVIADIIVRSGDCVSGFLDDDPNIDCLGKTEDIHKVAKGNKFIIGIGDNYIRKQIAEKYDVEWHTAIHPSAVIASDASIGEGTAVMAGAVVNPSAKVGRHCIINTGALVEHDCGIADYTHVSPRAATGGTVVVGELTHIGIGAVIKNNISVAPECVVGAGAVVVKDIAEKGKYIGVPARKA